MKLRHFAITVLLFVLGAHPLLAGHTTAQLVLGLETARPGETVLAGVQLHMEPGWHTYWKNPGASGTAIRVEWQLPQGVTAGEIQWPLPEKSTEDGLTTYTYKDEVVLIVPLTVSETLKAGPVQISAKISWLECETMCIPSDTEVEATLKLDAQDKPSQNAPLIASWKQKIPLSTPPANSRIWWETTAGTNSRLLLIEWSSAVAVGEAEFFPYEAESFEVQPTTERVPAESGLVRLRKEVRKSSGDWPTSISGVLVQTTPAGREAREFKASLSPAKAKAGEPLIKMLVYAFLGGLILNIMPCVLPVIALKILGFVGQARSSRGEVRALGLMYALGVLVSFLALAGVVIGVRFAGHQAGWGMQFGEPRFLVILTILVTLVALNLFGLFEINPGSHVMDAAGSLADRHGRSGSFMNGVLATVLATPCTAPFLSASLGFAFAQSAGVIILFFLTIGVGLASPYVLLSWQPAWLRYLPKPGAWMEKFKIAMGFPMLATALWVSSLLPIHYGDKASWMGMFLVVLALGAWIYGQFVQRGQTRRGLAVTVLLVILLVAYLGILEGQMHWRTPQADPSPMGVSGKTTGDLIDWKPWSPQAVTAARAEGRIVLVDFTAKWCITCNGVVKPALESAAVRERLKQINAVTLLADYTLLPENITTELKRFGRAGVPLVLVYPKDASAPPVVFDLVTSSTVLEALNQAAR